MSYLGVLEVKNNKFSMFWISTETYSLMSTIKLLSGTCILTFKFDTTNLWWWIVGRPSGNTFVPAVWWWFIWIYGSNSKIYGEGTDVRAVCHLVFWLGTLVRRPVVQVSIAALSGFGPLPPQRQPTLGLEFQYLCRPGVSELVLGGWHPKHQLGAPLM